MSFIVTSQYTTNPNSEKLLITTHSISFQPKVNIAFAFQIKFCVFELLDFLQNVKVTH